MDYEIFLLSRVRTIFDETGDNARSIGEGLADTGSVITSAALIMVAVFGAFAFARDVIVQMIGLGLAVAVLVDATVIRSALGPALMQSRRPVELVAEPGSSASSARLGCRLRGRSMRELAKRLTGQK